MSAEGSRKIIEQEVAEIDAATLRSAFGRYPTGVVALCALDGETPVGLAANSFTSVSLAPPLVSVCIANESQTWPLLRDRPRLGLSVLADTHAGLCRQLSAKNVDRFAGVPWSAGACGEVLIEGASAWFRCSIHDEVTAGDHRIVVLALHGLTLFDPEPLVFHGSRFRSLA
ncbi:flavin reductase family protein [Nocardia suismassiliense]|uniref:flavin reductase family protein n=1 Tax=Nocardia suismassiliense TaxID=2077092 RepID=UPI000D1F269C|nr:flavin reductase family protein [Nocardia suismassiliense]